MASKNMLVIVLAIVVVTVTFPTVTLAMEFWVGDATGWTVDFDYQAWAKDKVFHVGDKLVFKYDQGLHNVIKANKTEFDSCMATQNLALTSGQDVITLATSGKKWYICGKANHCTDSKQKLAITVHEVLSPATAPTPEGPASSACGIKASGYQVFMAVVFALPLFSIV